MPINNFTNKNILIFGNGYSGKFLSICALKLGYLVTVVSRNPEFNNIKRIKYLNFSDLHAVSFEIEKSIIISTVPPNKEGKDPVLFLFNKTLKYSKNTIGYISSTSVYNDGLIYEESPTNPIILRGKNRVQIENLWLNVCPNVQIFRSGGIYGPGRHPMIKFLNGNLEVLTKSNHFPNRINVEDLAGIILIAINQHKPGRIVNVTDQKSVTSYEAISYVANTLSLNKPIPVDFEKSSISEMAKSFFNTSKIVKSNVINKEFKYQYLHPDYKEALLALTKNLI